MTPTVIANLRRAKVPWSRGMSALGCLEGMDADATASVWLVAHVRPEGTPIYRGLEWDEDQVIVDAVPYIDDRATYLLLLDEAESRGIRAIFHGSERYTIHECRALYLWCEDALRSAFAKLLAHALAETSNV